MINEEEKRHIHTYKSLGSITIAKKRKDRIETNQMHTHTYTHAYIFIIS